MSRRLNSECARALLVAATLLATSMSASAQRPGGGPGRESDAMSDVKLDALAPDVKIFDAQGKERSIRDLLKGHTTAIVFGCLT